MSRCISKLWNWSVSAALICPIVLLSGMLLKTFAPPFVARPLGQLTAYFDISRGQYKVLIYGLTADGEEYRRLLRERYGIDILLEGCLGTYGAFAYAKGYNDVSVEAAKRKFGKDIFEQASADASNLKRSGRR